MGIPLTVLLLEDRPDDADLLLFELGQAGYAPTWRRVDTRAAFVAALDPPPDLILADYSLPQFTALDALDLMAERGVNVPIIVVSGVMNEETCVEALRHGAVDYLLKDRLTRLGPAIATALRDHRLDSERREAEAAWRAAQRRFRAAFDRAPIGMAVTTADGSIVEANPALSRMTGLGDVVGQALRDLIVEHDRYAVDHYLRRLAEGEPSPVEIRVYNATGVTTWGQYSASRIESDLGDTQLLVHQVADITDRRRAEQAVLRQAEQLARSNRDLVELDRLKNEFVSTVSHELRTPLTTILGYTELLTESSEHLSPAERRIVATIDRNGERLLALIEDLLTFSALDGGRLPVRRAHLDLATLIVEACAQAAPGDRPDRVEVDLADDLPPLDADAGQMQRVLATLLSNAVTHSPDGAPVRVTGRVADGHVVVSVRDSGVGIPEHEQAQLFTPFYRTSYAQQHAIKGSGLGLAIAKAIVDTHGGWMRLSSTPGAGTTVSFGLPATR